MSEDEEERVSEDEEEDEEEGVGHRGVRRHSRLSLRRRRRVWATAVRDRAPRVAGDAAADLSANEAPLARRLTLDVWRYPVSSAVVVV